MKNSSIVHARLTKFLNTQQMPFHLLGHQTSSVNIEDAARQRELSQRS